jgi:hypothetical protein
MFSLSRCLRSPRFVQASERLIASNVRNSSPQWSAAAAATTTTTTTTNITLRSFSAPPSPNDPQTEFKAEPPTALNLEMAEGIQNANMLILRHGVGAQRLKLLAQSDNDNMPLVLKWQRMMEIYLGAQLHVIAALGYDTNEQGIMMYTQQLAQFVSKCDPETQETFRTIGRETWRGMLSTAFDLDENLLEEKCGEEMTIVEARNTVHRVATKLMEPIILETVAKRCGELPHGTYMRI